MLAHDRKPNETLHLVEQLRFVLQVRFQALTLQFRINPAHHGEVQIFLLDEQPVALQQLDQSALADLQKLFRMNGYKSVQIDDAGHLVDLLIAHADLPVLVE